MTSCAEGGGEAERFAAHAIKGIVDASDASKKRRIGRKQSSLTGISPTLWSRLGLLLGRLVERHDLALSAVHEALNPHGC